MTLTLDRPTTRPVTKLFPESEPIVRFSGVASGIEDRSIIVIENPAVTRLTGFLFSETFEADRTSGEVAFIGVSHYRVNRGDVKPRESRKYHEATARRGFDGTRYFAHVSAGGGTLPLPSRRPYEVRFVAPEEFGLAKSMMDDPARFQEGLSLVYELLTKKPGVFSMDGNNLTMPPDYASLRLG